MPDPASQPDRLIEVVGAIVRRPGQILITQRPDSAEMGGLWEFPGGKVEPGESYEQALKREMMEELGVEVEVGNLYSTAEYIKPPATLVRLFFYNCRLVSGELTLLWGQNLRWVTPDELDSYDFPPADAELVERLSIEA